MAFTGNGGAQAQAVAGEGTVLGRRGGRCDDNRHRRATDIDSAVVIRPLSTQTISPLAAAAADGALLSWHTAAAAALLSWHTALVELHPKLMHPCHLAAQAELKEASTHLVHWVDEMSGNRGQSRTKAELKEASTHVADRRWRHLGTSAPAERRAEVSAFR